MMRHVRHQRRALDFYNDHVRHRDHHRNGTEVGEMVPAGGSRGKVGGGRAAHRLPTGIFKAQIDRTLMKRNEQYCQINRDEY